MPSRRNRQLEKQLAERIAKGVRGVRDVRSDLIIQYEDAKRSDPEIPADISSRLKWDALVREGRLTVRVEDAKVTREGVVGSLAEKARAHADAWVKGVQSVDESKVHVRWWTRDEDLRARADFWPRTSWPIRTSVRRMIG